MRTIFSALSALTLLAIPATAEDLSKDQLIEQLKKGGHIIYIRHASTEKDYADQVTANVNDGSTQRVLSEAGWHEAVGIGEGFRSHQIPIADVLSSEYFRAWQTAWLAFGKYEKKEVLNFLPFEDYTDAQVEQMKERVGPLLKAVPPKGKNTVIVAHDDPFEANTGIYPEPQGVAYILQPDGKGFKILGHIKPDAWK